MTSPEPPVLLLASKRCAECMTSRNRIVSGARAAEIVRNCRRQDIHFCCHKGSAVGKIVHCRGVHDLNPSRAFRFATALGIEIVEVDPDQLEK